MPPTVAVQGGTATASREVLGTGPDSVGDSGRPGRRRWLAAATGLGLLATSGAVAELVDRRDARDLVAAQEQRDRSAVDLVLLDDWSGSSAYEPATNSIAYELSMTVRNAGPRDVQVLAIGLPGVQLDEPVALAHDEDRTLTLEGVYSCTESVPQRAPESVPFELRTEAGPRAVEVPIPAGMLDTDPLAAECEAARVADLPLSSA